MELFEKLKASGVKIDHHYSDLYCEDTEEAWAIIKEYPEWDYICYFDDIDKNKWLEIPFAYSPHWADKQSIIDEETSIMRERFPI